MGGGPGQSFIFLAEIKFKAAAVEESKKNKMRTEYFEKKGNKRE